MSETADVDYSIEALTHRLGPIGVRGTYFHRIEAAAIRITAAREAAHPAPQEPK